VLQPFGELKMGESTARVFDIAEIDRVIGARRTGLIIEVRYRIGRGSSDQLWSRKEPVGMT
jgi:hypothetical protein